MADDEREREVDETLEADEAADTDTDARTAHDERVAGIAATLASLIAKGEEVVAALGVQAEAAGAAFDQSAAAADATVSDFAATVQSHVEKAAAQFAADLDIITRAIDDQLQDDQEASDEERATDEEQAAEDVDSVPSGQPVFTAEAQAFRARMKVGSGSELMLTDPEFVERFANFAFDDVPSDVDLPDRTRFMCWLATLLGCQGVDEFRAILPAALNMGVEPVTVKEIVYQGSAYLGIGRVYPFLKATNDVLMAAGVELPLPSQAGTEPTEQSRFEGGERAQMACFGEQMRGYKDRGAADYPHINRWLVKHCFGDWYTRGGLTIPEREMVTFCFLAAQGGCEAQLRGHTAANVQCGNDRDFLIKVVSNNVPFIGYPRSLNAMAVVEEVTGAQQ